MQYYSIGISKVKYIICHYFDFFCMFKIKLSLLSESTIEYLLPVHLKLFIQCLGNQYVTRGTE